MKSFLQYMFIIMLLLLPITPQAYPHAGGHSVEWPALESLYELSEQAQEVIGEGSLDDLQILALEIDARAHDVMNKRERKGVSNSLAIKFFVDDIISISTILKKANTMPKDALVDALNDMHSSIEALIVEAGLPVGKTGLGPHDGILIDFFEGNDVAIGSVEVKLHSDKGDLEIWLTSDNKPFDISTTSVIRIMFPDINDRMVELRVRNENHNEDENGKPNIRGDRTNYFIYPGNTGADASWLKGKSFESEVQVSFMVQDTFYVSEVFTLKPHSDHHTHNHHH